MENPKQAIDKIIKLIDSIDVLSLETEIDDLILYNYSDELDFAKDSIENIECLIVETIDYLTLAKKSI